MFNKIKIFFFLLTPLLFFFLVIKFYFSEENKIRVNKIRAYYMDSLSINLSKLPLLKNDTKDFFEYNDNSEDKNIKKTKRKFWDLINN